MAAVRRDEGGDVAPRPFGTRGPARVYDDLSQGSVRFGQGWFLDT